MKSQAGQAFIEVLVAVVILSLSIVPFLALYMQTARGAAQASYREGAVQATSGVMEQLLAGSTPSASQTIDNYTVTWTKTAVNGRTGLSQLLVTATYKDRDGSQSYALTTYTRR